MRAFRTGVHTSLPIALVTTNMIGKHIRISLLRQYSPSGKPSLAMLGLSVSYGLSRRSLLYLGGGNEEGDELPDVGETLQVLDHVAHPVDVLGRHHPLGAVEILHVVLVPGHRVADGAPEVTALALQHPSVLHGHDGVGTAAYRRVVTQADLGQRLVHGWGESGGVAERVDTDRVGDQRDDGAVLKAELAVQAARGIGPRLVSRVTAQLDLDRGHIFLREMVRVTQVGHDVDHRLHPDLRRIALDVEAGID